MAEENIKDNKEQQEKNEKNEDQSSENKEKLDNKKATQKKEMPKENLRRNFVIINGKGLHISVKAGKHICDMIRYKNIDQAIKMLEEVISFKRAVKMNNREIGHRHGKGMMAGRYPINTSKEFLNLLKQLKSSGIYHEIEVEKAILGLCITNKASRPYKRGGARAKRANVLLKLEIKDKNKKGKEAKMEKK